MELVIAEADCPQWRPYSTLMVCDFDTMTSQETFTGGGVGTESPEMALVCVLVHMCACLCMSTCVHVHECVCVSVIVTCSLPV